MSDGYIYFDENKNAYGFPIEGAVARVEKEVWDKYSNRSAGDGWDIVGRAFVSTIQPEAIDIENAKLEKRLERNNHLTDADWRLQRAQDEHDSATEDLIREYRKYLRDFTNNLEWWKQAILSFEEFSEVTK